VYVQTASKYITLYYTTTGALGAPVAVYTHTAVFSGSLHIPVHQPFFHFLYAQIWWCFFLIYIYIYIYGVPIRQIIRCGCF